MRLKLKMTLAAALLALGGVFTLTTPVFAQGGAAGQAKTDVCQGVQNVTGGSCNDNGNDISNVLKVALQILSIVAGVAAVIMIVIAGLKYTTSGGNSSQVSEAKSAIIYAVVGLIIIAMAQLIIAFVINGARTGNVGN